MLIGVCAGLSGPVLIVLARFHMSTVGAPEGRTTSNTRLRRRIAHFCQRDAEAL
jgi:hypothetical protein